MITNRNYKDDYLKIMDFLREMHKLNDNQNCWLPQKWEYTENFIDKLNIERGGKGWYPYIHIWEEDGKIVAVCHNESDKTAFMEIRSGYERLYDEMLDWAEKNIGNYSFGKDENKKLNVHSLQSMDYRNNELQRRGYKRDLECCYQNYQLTSENTYNPKLPDGYEFVDKRDVHDPRARQFAVHKGFHPQDEFPEKCPESFIDMEKAPLFRDDLELMVKYNDQYIALCVIWVDQDTNTALFEPVSTHPEHQGKGIGKQMIIEGLRRLKEMGVNKVYVESYNDSRKEFYNKCGFTTYDADWNWTKEIE